MQTLTHQYWLAKERQMELLAESQQQALLRESQLAGSAWPSYNLMTTTFWELASLASKMSFPAQESNTKRANATN